MEDVRHPRWRLHLLFGVLAAALLALIGRVAHLQYWRGEELIEFARGQQKRVILLPARPGNIFGRTAGGPVLLAASKQVPSCYVDPGLLSDAELPAVAARVAAALQVPKAEVLATIMRRRNTRFAFLARGITPDQAEAVRKLKIAAVKTMHEWRRHYPNGETAAHVLGFRQVDGAAAAGIERKADKWLKATAGRKVMRDDAARGGRMARLVEYEAPRDGRNVILTLDVMIQHFLERALAEAVEEFGNQEVTDPAKATAAMGVVLDPSTGEVLAMASIPTYNPNHYQTTSSAQRRNRVVTDPFEPGSAFKPFIVAGAVQMGRATMDSQFHCYHGTYHAHNGGTIRDFPGERFGDLPLVEILIHSSNIGMAKLGERLGNESLWRIVSAFGYGRRTGIDIPGECPGRLVPTSEWTGYATRRLPFGQGPIMVTNLQLATAFAAIANGGLLMKPRVIHSVLDTDGKLLYRGEKQAVRRVLTPPVAREMIQRALVNVVRRGTGKRCRLDDWQAFGKTGTAQIGGPGGYEERAYTATFVAGAPALKPALVCAISVYRPDYGKGYTGGKVAAPAVRKVLAKSLPYLSVPPDDYESVAARLEAARPEH